MLKIVTGNICRFSYLNRIIIIIARILLRRVMLIEDQILMSRIIVNICEPTHPLDTDIFSAMGINSTSSSIERITVRYTELPIAAVDRCPQPQSVLHDQRKYFLISDRIDISDDEKIFLICDKLSNKLTKQGKWRIRYNDIGFLQEFQTLRTPKVPITIE